MSLTGAVPQHPAEFSPEIIDWLSKLLSPGECVHDPFAGRGVRLGALCDELGCPFTGTDIEVWEDADPRVMQGDSASRVTYPSAPFTVVTSPVYFNRISTDYLNGPTDVTKINGRRSYGISLGRPLDAHNLARLARSPARFYAGHSTVARHWDRRVLLNIDLPMIEQWKTILDHYDYRIISVIPIVTRRYRGPANSEKRPDHEVLIDAFG